MDIYIIVILFFLPVYQLFVCMINVIFPQYIPHGASLTDTPKISVLIPMRNEEHNINNILTDLVLQTYKNLEIIVLDDNSTDDTYTLASRWTNEYPNIKVIKGDDLPVGWLGKNWACHQLSVQANGEYMLYIDADVRLSPVAIQSAVYELIKYKLDLLSVFPHQHMHTWGERVVIPLMHYILTTMLPLIFVKKVQNNMLSAANGQFMLFSTNTYKKYHFHEKVRHEIAEDIHIARYMKLSHCNVGVYIGDNNITCRMYDSYKSAINGFAKNIHEMLSGSYVVAIAFVLLHFIVPVIFIACNEYVLFAIYILMMLYIRVLSSIHTYQNVIINVILYIPHIFILFYLVVLNINNRLQHKTVWKGRVIS
ncbi:MAG: glycosyltransferase family 2 protein [Cytophagales bacterium]|nr:glycosyltransferase family 2 protein [Cytophagales bacterium]